MKNAFRITALILAMSVFNGCGTSTETAASPDQAGTIENEAIATDALNEYYFDIYNFLESREFAGAFDSATTEINPLRVEYDMSNAYIGTPYQIVNYDSNGEFSAPFTIKFPVMSDNNAAAIISGSAQDDDTYVCSAGIDYSKKLNEILSSGKEYAIVTTYDRKVGLAISEDDEIHVLYDYTYSDETDLSPNITFEEAGRFNNVISLESLTTMVYP